MAYSPVAVTETDIATARLRTHVLQAGRPESPVLVLVHGNVSAASFFAPVMTGLAERWHCVAPDLRGFGGSERAPVDARRGLRDFTEDLAALLDGGGVVPDGQRVHLLGWSLGAGVVMQYAMDHPGRVASIVLESPMSPYGFGGTKDADGTPCWPDFAGSGGGTASPDLVRLIAAGERGGGEPASPRQVLTTLYVRPPAPFPGGLEDALVDAILQMAIGDDHYPGDVTESANWPHAAPGERGVNNAISPRYCDLSGFAGIQDRPDVLWIRGEADQIVADESMVDLGHLGALGAVPGWPGPEVFPAQPMVSQLRALLDRYQGAGGRYTEQVLTGCGHSPHLEQPDTFADLVTGFLAGHQAASG
jgi:pimeloyl-ACP methyl ester carboxylesterase